MARCYFIASLLAANVLSSCVVANEPPIFSRTPLPESPRLQNRQIVEASGLAASVRGGDFLWLMNDSGGEPVLYLAGTDGSDRGSAKVEGAVNVDWEDLAGFRWNGRPYLLIAAIGDNNALRDHLTLYLLPEVFLFERSGDESWADAFARKPHALDRHRLVQAESVAFSRDGNSLFVVSEGIASPIVRYTLATPVRD